MKDLYNELNNKQCNDQCLWEKNRVRSTASTKNNFECSVYL